MWGVGWFASGMASTHHMTISKHIRKVPPRGEGHATAGLVNLLGKRWILPSASPGPTVPWCNHLSLHAQPRPEEGIKIGGAITRARDTAGPAKHASQTATAEGIPGNSCALEKKKKINSQESLWLNWPHTPHLDKKQLLDVVEEDFIHDHVLQGVPEGNGWHQWGYSFITVILDI